MSEKYGFGGGIELPKMPQKRKSKKERVDDTLITGAVEAGASLGFVDRDPSKRLKPGPKRKEPQDKVSIPGPKRIIDEFRSFCVLRDLTLWQGLELLLKHSSNDADGGE